MVTGMEPDDRYVVVTAAAGHQLAASIKRRMDADPELDQAELVRRSGVSHPAVRALMRGEPGRRGRTQVRRVSAALGWTPDSIERILDGREPENAPVGDDELVSRISRLEDQMSEILSILRGLQGS